MLAESDLDSMIEAAILPRHELAGGAVLHINTPPGAAVVDGDSGSSNLSPSALADAMVAPVAEAMLLRRISGPVVIDFRGSTAPRAVDAAMRQAVAGDPPILSPRLPPGGLYTLTRPWRWRPLADLRAPTRSVSPCCIAACPTGWHGGENRCCGGAACCRWLAQW